MEQEQMDHLHFRTEETYVLQKKTESTLTHIQDLLSNHKYLLPSHGFGLSIIEDICQKYDGAYQWLDRTDYFDSIVLLKFL